MHTSTHSQHKIPLLDELRRSWLTVRHQCLSPKESTYPYAQSSSTYILYLEGDTKFGAVIRPLVNTEDINRQLLRVRNNKQHFIACLPIALFSRTLPRRRNDDLGSVSYPQHHNPCSNAQGLQISVTCWQVYRGQWYLRWSNSNTHMPVCKLHRKLNVTSKASLNQIAGSSKIVRVPGRSGRFCAVRHIYTTQHHVVLQLL